MQAVAAQASGAMGADAPRLRVLVVHNYYQHTGGEDAVVEAEIALLRRHGHEVHTYFRDNHDVDTQSHAESAAQTLWSARTRTEVARQLKQFRPDLMHVHNTFPLISPSVYGAAHDAGVPVVQSLHNFRLLCPQATFLREGAICEQCIGRVPWRGVVHACYRDSHRQSGVLASMLTLHRGLGTWRHKVTRYIALNEFCRRKFMEGGLPGERIKIKPNFVDFEAPGESPRAGFLFVGRLSVEKGLAVLGEAADALPGVQVRVAGEGPLAAALAQQAPSLTQIGSLAPSAVRAEMATALAMVLPSICYESFPRTLVEAFASGLPVIASRLGPLPDLVIEGETGMLFEPGNAADLAQRMRWAIEHPAEMAAMGARARRHYEDRFTAERNYGELMAIYAGAVDAVLNEKSNR